MDPDKLARLAHAGWTTGAHGAGPAAGRVAARQWDDVPESHREGWRAAADAVRTAVESALPAFLPPLDPYAGPALRERIIMGIAASAGYSEPDDIVVARARKFESYILGTAQNESGRVA